MRIAASIFILLLPLSLSADQRELDANVNSKYTVESVEVVPRQFSHISTKLRRDMQRLVGEKVNTDLLQDLQKRLQREIQSGPVVQRIVRGTKPEYVRVVFEVGRKERDFRLTLPRLVYHARQGWSGGVDGELRLDDNVFSAGVLSNGDELVERFSGVRASYERLSLGTGRAGFRFTFEDYHQQWNSATNSAYAAAVDSGRQAPDLYAHRRNIEPMVKVQLARPLTLEAGVSFETIDTKFPAAKSLTSGALKTTLRLSRHWESSEFPSSLEAGYSLRAATRTLGSDFVYNRHTFYADYDLEHGPHNIRAGFQAGTLHGAAPMFERFELGDSRTLRGWNKCDIAPLGADKVVQGTIDYAFHGVDAFYDVGSVWSRQEAAKIRHSAGIGLRWKGFFLAVAFPIRSGNVSPILMMAVDL